MKGSEFIKRVQRHAKETGKSCEWHPDKGKGSHGVLYLGDKISVVRNPKDELKTPDFSRDAKATWSETK